MDPNDVERLLTNISLSETKLELEHYLKQLIDCCHNENENSVHMEETNKSSEEYVRDSLRPFFKTTSDEDLDFCVKQIIDENDDDDDDNDDDDDDDVSQDETDSNLAEKNKFRKRDNTTLEEWKQLSQQQQAEYSKYLSSRIWDSFSSMDELKLFQAIAFALYGPPQEERDDFGLPDEQKKKVDDIKMKFKTESCYEKRFKEIETDCKKWGVNNQRILNFLKNRKSYQCSANNVFIAKIFIFVYVNEKTQHCRPVFRVRSHLNKDYSQIPQNTFIDHQGRIYESWAKYKEENQENESWLCVPQDGYYSVDDRFEVWDQSGRGKVLKTLDDISMKTNIASTVGLLAGTAMTFFPLTAPIGAGLVASSAVAGLPSGFYGTGRSIGQLVDRRTHGESISLNDPTARNNWLSTVASIASVGTMGATRFLSSSAQAGSVVSSTAEAVCNGLLISSVCISGVSIGCLVYDMSKKEKIERLDVFQLTTSILFFTHSVVSFKTANNIFSETQQNHLDATKSGLSKSNKRQFRKMLKTSITEKGEMRGKADFIKGLNSVENKNKFFRNVYINKNGKAVVNRKLRMDCKEYLNMPETDRKDLLKLTQKLRNKKISLTDYGKKSASILKEINFDINVRPSEAKRMIRETFGVNNLGEIKIGNIDISKLQPFETSFLLNLVKGSLGGNKRLIDVIKEIANRQGTHNVEELGNVIHQVTSFVKQEARTRNIAYQMVLDEILDCREKLYELVNQLDDKNFAGRSRIFPKINSNKQISIKHYYKLAVKLKNLPVWNYVSLGDIYDVYIFFSKKHGAKAIYVFNGVRNILRFIHMVPDDDDDDDDYESDIYDFGSEEEYWNEEQDNIDENQYSAGNDDCLNNEENEAGICNGGVYNEDDNNKDSDEHGHWEDDIWNNENIGRYEESRNEAYEDGMGGYSVEEEDNVNESEEEGNGNNRQTYRGDNNWNYNEGNDENDNVEDENGNNNQIYGGHNDWNYNEEEDVGNDNVALHDCENGHKFDILVREQVNEISNRPTNTRKKTKIVLGDFKIRPKYAISKLKTENIEVESYAGIRILEMVKILRKKNFQQYSDVMVHVGTNDIHQSRTPDDIMNNSKQIIVELKKKKVKRIVISGVIYRRDEDPRYIVAVNGCLEYVCKLEKVKFVDPNVIIKNTHLGNNGVHLNSEGTKYMKKYIQESLNESMQE